MGLLFLVLVVLLVSLTSSAQQKKITRKIPTRNVRNSANRRHQTPAVERLHQVLRSTSGPHDTYLALAELGTKQTVPLLLDRLRLDYGVAEPPPSPGLLVGFVCTQIHLVDALRTITNTDRGMYYPEWASWWEANKDLTQHQWILNGFETAGLHVVEPIDERFGLELMEVMGQRRGHLATNARRLLEDVPAERRAQWIVHAANSEQNAMKSGALAVLEKIDTLGYEEHLRNLAQDSDAVIRREALTILNDRLRASRSVPRKNVSVINRSRKDYSFGLVAITENILITAFSDQRVVAIDIRSKRPLWQRRIAFSPDHLLATGDRILLGSKNGDLVSINRSGRRIWQARSASIKRMLLNGSDVFVVGDGAVERIDATTGVVTSRTSTGSIRDADFAPGLAFIVDDRGLHSLYGTAKPECQMTRPIGLSVTQQSICVTNGGYREGDDNRVTCLAPDTLAPQWTRRISRNGTWGHEIAPVQTGSQVFVPTDDDLTAFRASDGALLWTTSGGQESHGRIMPTDYGLLIENEHGRPELRDFATGEVLCTWPQIGTIWRFAVQGQHVAVSGLNGEIWLIDLGKSGLRHLNR